MPCRIYGIAKCGIVLHVDAFHPVTVYEDGSAMVAPDVEEAVAGGAVLLRGVAVDAVVVVQTVGVAVLVDGAFVEVRQTPLVDAQLTVEFVRRFYESVGEVGVDFVCSHGDMEGRVVHPFVATAGIDIDFKVVSA